MRESSIAKFATVLIIASTYITATAEGNLSLHRAAELTFSNNHTIKAAEQKLLAAHYNRQAAKGLYMPKISTTAAWLTLQKDIAIDVNPLKTLLGGLDIAPLLGLDWSYTLQKRNMGIIEADITIPLFTGGKIIAANRAAEAEERGVVAESVACRNSLFSQLVERYFAVTLASNVVKVRELVVRAMEQHQRDISLLCDNGMATKSELLYINYTLTKSRQQLHSAELTLATARNALSTTVGIDSVGHTSTPIFICKALESLDSFMGQAENSNPKLHYIDSQMALAKQNIAIHRAAFFPEIAAIAGGGFGHNLTNILPRWAVGVGLKFTIFDGLSRHNRYAAAKSTAKRAKEVKSAANQDVKLLVQSLYNRCTDYLEQSIALEESIAFAQEYLSNIKEAFLQDMASSTEVIDATTVLAASQIEQLEAAYNFDIYLAKMLETAGASERFFEYINSAHSKNIEYEVY